LIDFPSGPILLIVILALFAILTPSQKNLPPSNLSSTQSSSPPRSSNGVSDFASMLAEQQPKLPSHTKDGKPIDPHTLEYAAELQHAMEDYENEMEGAGDHVIESGNKLANAYITAGFYREGIQVCQQVLSVVEAEHGSVSEIAIFPLKMISKASSELGMFRESAEYLTFLEGVVSDIYGRTHPDTLGVLMSMVGLYIHTGNVDSALLKLQQYIEFLENEYHAFQSELETLTTATEGSSSTKTDEYEVVHEILEILSALGEMNYGCSMAWDRVASDPEGIHNLKRLRDEQQREQQQLEEEEEIGKESLITNEAVTDESEPYTSYEIYRNQEYYRREVIHYREQVVSLINKYKQQRVEKMTSMSSNSNEINPYVVGVASVDARAKLAQGIQQYAYLRYQHGTIDTDTLKFFHDVVDLSTELALDTNPLVNHFHPTLSSSSSSSSTSNPTTTPSLQPATEPSLLQYPVNKDVAISLNNLGSVYLDMNDLNQAEYFIRQSLLIREEIVTHAHAHQIENEVNDEIIQNEIDLAMCKGNLGRVLLKREQWNEGEIELKEGLDLLENHLKNMNNNQEKKSKILPFVERLQYQLHQGAEMRLMKETTTENNENELENDDNDNREHDENDSSSGEGENN
jgi:hypothetical protein